MSGPGAVPAQEAGQWELIGRRFTKHRLALWTLYVLVIFYAIGLSAPFLAPYPPDEIHSADIYMPPQLIHVGFVEGHTLPRLYVHPMSRSKDPVTLENVYTVDTTRRQALLFFHRGFEWNLFGLVGTERHFVGVSGGTCYLLGTDGLGRDQLSRLLYGGRISLLIGLIGVVLTFVIGLLLGGISGYFGGRVDLVIQRMVELFESIPNIPLWLALAAAIPKDWTSLEVYFAMTLILALVNWTGLCRITRGKILSLREEVYAKAALLSGASEKRIIFVHLMPNFASHIIASLTLAIPGMIAAETALSFLGVGLRPPIFSWGVLLSEANNVDIIYNYPWLLMPGLMVIIAVLAWNLVGEGLRDAVDPYA